MIPFTALVQANPRDGISTGEENLVLQNGLSQLSSARVPVFGETALPIHLTVQISSYEALKKFGEH